ncbi:hypothetical protein TELCIR_10435 [Teladorsagia circumcincta]|uniref:Uncharacterized protein n=1 Tax=Teladorsagia circumcincta TaxID=45464 RepID=A0A2G9UC45_TELCI|nr:hypothetical protein TELCIR_10435 [Teladorsagia circumcincta]
MFYMYRRIRLSSVISIWLQQTLASVVPQWPLQPSSPVYQPCDVI